MRARPLIAALLCIAGPAPAAERPCLTGSDAEALTLVAMPDVIRETGQKCAAQLPATSLLRRPTSPMLSRYAVEADRAWPAVRAAIVKLSDPTIDLLLQSDYARPLLSSLVVPQLTARIAAKDCGTLDRLVTLLEPLPPRNTAGVVVAALHYLRADEPKPGTPAATLPLCLAKP